MIKRKPKARVSRESLLHLRNTNEATVLKAKHQSGRHLAVDLIVDAA